MILRNPDGAAGGDAGNATFLATLPEDLRKEPSLATFKDPGALAKSYVEAQKLIGAKRIALPGEKASEVEWEAFYNSVGRPDTADKYENVEIKDEKGNVLLKPDEKELGELKKFFHKMGLTSRQAKQMQEYSLNYLVTNKKGQESASQQQAQQAEQSLRAEWGDKFDVNVEVARSVVKKFGDPEISEFLEKSGLGNNAGVIKLLAKIGDSILEDSGRRGGGGDVLPLNDSARARQEIENLKIDTDFQKALGDATHIGHNAAATRWTNLFKVAFPGSQGE